MKMREITEASAFMVAPDISHLRRFHKVYGENISQTYLLDNQHWLFILKDEANVTMSTTVFTGYPYVPLYDRFRWARSRLRFETGTAMWMYDNYVQHIPNNIRSLANSIPVVIYSDRIKCKLRYAISVVHIKEYEIR